MPASIYTPGYGSTLAYAVITGGSPGAYNHIGQSVDLGGPSPEVGDIKVTNNDSPNNTHEYGPGMIEPGVIEFELVYESTVLEALYALFGNGIIYSFQETFPDNSYWTFTGYFKKFGTETKTEDDAIKNKISIKVTGKPVFTPHS
jgi:hypothetical protein